MKTLNELLKKYRISYPMTQKQLAEKSGVSLRAIQLFENGADIKVSTLIKLLEALDLSDNLNMLIPDVTKRPSYVIAEQKINHPKRARTRSAKKKTGTFKWGDE